MAFKKTLFCGRMNRLLTDSMKTASLLNGFTLCTLALAASAWTLFFLQDSQALDEKGLHIEGDFPMNQVFEVTESTSFTLNGKDGLTALPGTTLQVDWDQQSEQVTVELTAGTVLASTLSEELQITIESANAKVLSQNNLVIVKAEETTQDLTVYAISHPALVRFFAGEKELNALEVPGAYRMKISSAKVTETLAKLRLTKLSKEFPVYALSDEDLTEEMNEALKEIHAHYDASTLAFLDQLQENSDFGPALSGFSSQVSQGYTSFQDALTVIPEAQQRLSETRKADALVYATSNCLADHDEACTYWLSAWKGFEQDPVELKTLYSSLFFVLPGDELYPLKEAIAELLFPHEEPFLVLRRQYAQIESLLDRASQVDAQQAYAAYQTQFESLLESGAFDDPSYLDEINREYILLELMLRSNSVFYSTDSTHLLKLLEQKIFALAGSEDDLDEERQAFVQSKIRFLSNLFTYVLDKKITIEEASALAQELIYEAEAYMNSISSQVAVRDYFESKLEEFTLSVQFMNSPEFYSYDSFEEGLSDYKKKVSDLADLNDYLQNIRSGEEQAAALSVEEATQQAKDDLYTHGIQYKEVNSLGDGANRLFEIVGGRTAGYAFTAKYDLEGEILYDVEVGELRFSTGLTLETAKTVIENAMAGQQTGTDVSDEDASDNDSETSGQQGSLTETVALEIVQSQFKTQGLDPDSFTFTIVDLEANEFSFEGTASAFNLSVSGSYDADTERLSEVLWEFMDETHTLPDLDLKDFEGALEASYTALTE